MTNGASCCQMSELRGGAERNLTRFDQDLSSVPLEVMCQLDRALPGSDVKVFSYLLPSRQVLLKST